MLATTLSTLAIVSAGASVAHAAAVVDVRAAEPKCPTTKADYDYIVVGSGAGGGPVAANLAEAGFKVLVLEAGKDSYNTNSSVPLYFAKASEDPDMSLDYHVYTDKTKKIKQWYPRAQAIGGSTMHSAMANVLQADTEFDQWATLFKDPSWAASNMRKYYQRIERALYIPEASGVASGHGYDGWLATNGAPYALFTDPRYYDPQLLGIYGGLQGAVPPVNNNSDLNAISANNVVGGGSFSATYDENYVRSSIRGRLVKDAAAIPNALKIQTHTFATKILTCGSDVKAYGVEYAEGANLIAVAHQFQGKQKTLKTKTVTAKYEVIISAGVYQTPQLLMQSGIGNKVDLLAHGIAPVVDLPGVGQNLMDRLELSVVWTLKQNHVLLQNCTFGDDPKTDPCLAEWETSPSTASYSVAPGLWLQSMNTKPAQKVLDLWTTWSPANFHGYYQGYAKEVSSTKNALAAIILKARTKAQGWVKLTGSHPQDLLEINKNQYVTAGSNDDVAVLREGIKLARKLATSVPSIASSLVEETYPGAKYKTDAQIDEFIRDWAWGHHACCTAKMGVDSDKSAVLNKDFQVRGVKNLRVVDNSMWPSIPGMFITTPIYQAAEKASDVILAHAAANGYTGNAAC